MVGASAVRPAESQAPRRGGGLCKRRHGGEGPRVTAISYRTINNARPIAAQVRLFCPPRYFLDFQWTVRSQSGDYGLDVAAPAVVVPGKGRKQKSDQSPVEAIPAVTSKKVVAVTSMPAQNQVMNVHYK